MPSSAHAVLIGTAHCDQSEALQSLPAVTHNVFTLQHLLRSWRFNLASDQIEVFYDEKDKLKIERHFESEIERASYELLLVYYSGHGLLEDDANDGDELHLALGSTEDNFRGSSLESSHIVLPFVKSPSKVKILIFDCCKASFKLHNVLRKSTTRAGSVWAAGSTGPTANSFSPRETEPSLFTGELIKILDEGLEKSADEDRSAVGSLWLGVNETLQTTANRVIERTVNEGLSPQQPLVFGRALADARFARNAYVNLMDEPVAADELLRQDVSDWLARLRPGDVEPDDEFLDSIRTGVTGMYDWVATRGGGVARSGAPRASVIAADSVLDALSRYESVLDLDAKLKSHLREERIEFGVAARIADDQAVLISSRRRLIQSLEELATALRRLGAQRPGRQR